MSGLRESIREYEKKTSTKEGGKITAVLAQEGLLLWEWVVPTPFTYQQRGWGKG